MRVLNRFVSAVLAIALVAGSLLIAVEILLALFDREAWVIPWRGWYGRVQELPWSDPQVRFICFLTLAAALLLLLLQLAPRRPVALPSVEQRGVRTSVRRRGLEQAIERRVTAVDGISGAKAKASSRRIVVHATSNRRQPGDLRAQASSAAQEALGLYDLQPSPPLALTLRSRAEEGQS